MRADHPTPGSALCALHSPHRTTVHLTPESSTQPCIFTRCFTSVCAEYVLPFKDDFLNTRSGVTLRSPELYPHFFIIYIFIFINPHLNSFNMFRPYLQQSLQYFLEVSLIQPSTHTHTLPKSLSKADTGPSESKTHQPPSVPETAARQPAEQEDAVRVLKRALCEWFSFDFHDGIQD